MVHAKDLLIKTQILDQCPVCTLAGPPILKIFIVNKIRGSADLTSEQSLKLGDLKVIISCVLGILASQNRFQSLYDEIFNIERFLRWNHK